MEIKAIDKSAYTALEPTPSHSIPSANQPFVHAFLLFKDLLKHFLDSAETASSENSDGYALETYAPWTELSSIPLDTFHFGMFLHQLQQLKEQGLLLSAIQERRMELLSQKEHWRCFIETLKDGKNREFYQTIESDLKRGQLVPNRAGAGSSYFLVDEKGQPHFVVKPIDEDIFCLNNRKELGSPFNDPEHRVRDEIPLYRSAQTDALCWEIAILSGLEGTTPKTVMGMISSDRFYDFTKWIEDDIQNKFIQETGKPDKEKLCSIQEFIPDSQDLIERLHEFYAERLSDEEISSRFDQKDFEEVCMFLWLTFDNDGHGGNFRTYVKKIHESGKKIYGIKKIDNGLSFPEKNTQYLNILAWMPNAISPISDDLKQKIANLPIQEILNRMSNYELSNCTEAFSERVEILKSLAQREGISVGEIDLRMGFLSRIGGKEIALSAMTTDQILDLLVGESSSRDPKITHGAPYAAA